MPGFAVTRRHALLVLVLIWGSLPTAHAPAAQAGPAPRATQATVVLTAADSSLVHGQPLSLTVSGDLPPGSVVELQSFKGGVWTVFAHSPAGGVVVIRPGRSTIVRGVVLAADGTVAAASPELRVSVAPAVTLPRPPRGRAFVPLALTGSVSPAVWQGALKVRVRHGRRVVATVRGRVRNGRLHAIVPTPGVGRLAVDISLPARSGLASRTLTLPVYTSVRRLRIGSVGPDVRALLERLRQLNFHTVTPTTRYSHATYDAVLAFQKSQRMARTGAVDTRLWRALAAARPLTPRFARPALHIEVDKTRQLLKVVRNGRVEGAIAVSTGATGNTPVGAFRIYQMGGSYLPWFMAFHGNFGIHGYVPVPAFPASHGCVREPMWAAAWVFRRSRMGERVYVHN